MNQAEANKVLDAALERRRAAQVKATTASVPTAMDPVKETWLPVAGLIAATVLCVALAAVSVGILAAAFGAGVL